MAARKKAAAKKPQVKKAAPPPKRASRSLALAKALQAKFGSRAMLADQTDEAEEYLSTGIDVLDWYVLGRGGNPIGRMSEWFGPEGSCKTSLGYQMVAHGQKLSAVCVWIVGAGEGDIDRPRAQTFGVRLSDLVILYPENLEECFEQLKVVLGAHDPRSGPMLILWDSIASMVTKDGDTREAGSRRVGDVPLIMSEELKKIVPRLSKHRAHLAAINQIRSKIGVMYGDNTTTPGGFAPKYYASQRVQILGGKAVKNAKEEHVGKIVTMLAVKNRLGAPWLKAKVRLDYAQGFNNIWSTSYHAKRMKLIKARDEGFAGRGREGVEVYAEALKALAWNCAGLEALREAQEDVDVILDNEDPYEESEDGSDDEA